MTNITAKEAKFNLEYTFFMLNCGRNKEAEKSLDKVFNYLIDQTKKEMEK